MPNPRWLALLFLAASCTGGEPPRTGGTGGAAEAVAATPYAPVLDAADFVDRVDNPFFPLTPGTVFRYRSSDGEETNVVTVMDETRMILGIVATIVHDEVFEGGTLAEDTYDWYAQDRTGTVWYLGEDSREVEDGRVVSTAGSWESGVDGALPGILMEAQPAVGDAYRQEYRPGVAEDMGEVVAVSVRVVVPFGSFDDCVRTRDTTPLEPGVRETKVYCRGVGLVLEDEGRARNELVAVDRR